MKLLIEKEIRERRRANKYVQTVKNCASDIFHFGADGAPIFVSHNQESANQFMKDVRIELKRLESLTPPIRRIKEK